MAPKAAKAPKGGAMDQWQASFSDMDDTEYRQLLLFWIRHMRNARPLNGVGARYKSVMKIDGVGYNLCAWKVTDEVLEEQEEYATRRNTSPPQEVIFLGQPIRLLAKMLKSPQSQVENVSRDIQICVQDVVVTPDKAPLRQDVSYLICGLSNMVVTHDYRQMFAIVCGNTACWHATEKKDMTLADYAMWVEQHVTDGGPLHFTLDGTACMLNNSARNVDGITAHVTYQKYKMEFKLIDLYLSGTRLIRERYFAAVLAEKDVQSSSSSSSTSSSTSTDEVLDADTNYNDEGADTNKSLREELEKCQADLAAVTEERDRMRDVLGKLRACVDKQY